MVILRKMLEKIGNFSIRISTKEVEVMLTNLEPMLFIDLQAAKPACFCEKCGTERYAPSLICLRCERGCL